jgi:hypothetical protein
VITGFNTDIEHNGTTYHVQTEDKGLETPFILSLVYVGGAILASKRSPYTDLVDAGFDAAVLSERLQRQHKLICAAISSGRIEDLKRLSRRETSAPAQPVGVASAAAAPSVEPVTQGVAPGQKVAPPQKQGVAAGQVSLPQKDAPRRADATRTKPERVEAKVQSADAGAQSPPRGKVKHEIKNEPPQIPAAVDLEAAMVDELIPVELDDAIHVSLMEEKDFHAGEMITLRAMVTRGQFPDGSAVAGASVVVKVLGTEFRPLILTSKTGDDGLAAVHVWLPRFTKGRAAILVRATSQGYTAELRRVIHQS